jgi:hypothetical protein
VTLVYGDSDPFVTKEYLAGTAAVVRHADLVRIALAGHCPMVENTAAAVALWEASPTDENGKWILMSKIPYTGMPPWCRLRSPRS